tara:strand:- start:702 stop:1028 length:327 start_codon:yes stop_codon:yes gene_type:complete
MILPVDNRNSSKNYLFMWFVVGLFVDLLLAGCFFIWFSLKGCEIVPLVSCPFFRNQYLVGVAFIFFILLWLIKRSYLETIKHKDFKLLHCAIAFFIGVFIVPIFLYIS